MLAVAAASGGARRAGLQLALAGRPAIRERSRNPRRAARTCASSTARAKRRSRIRRSSSRTARSRRWARRDARVPAGARTIDLDRPHGHPRPRRDAQPHVLHDARPQRAAPVLGAAALPGQRHHHHAHHRRHLAVSRDQHEAVDRSRRDARAAHAPHRAVSHRPRRRRDDGADRLARGGAPDRELLGR